MALCKHKSMSGRDSVVANLFDCGVPRSQAPLAFSMNRYILGDRLSDALFRRPDWFICGASRSRSPVVSPIYAEIGCAGPELPAGR